MRLLKLRRVGEKASAQKDLSSALISPLPKDTLGISDQAAQRILFLLKQSTDPEQYLRVAIKGGGCSGLTLSYEFCKLLKPSDLVFEKNNVRVCIDPKSLGFLGGATLHCREELGVAELILVNNPSEKQCSCGKSFSL